jgi:hypothetical protein
MGQGKENSKIFLKAHPEIANEIEHKILNAMGNSPILLSAASADDDGDE